MDTDSGVPGTKPPLSPQAHLLLLPSELLIQDILLRLPIPSVIVCSQTCKFLHTLISSSSLLTYFKELTIAGMQHNSLCAYTSYPISKRLDMLREKERRWLCLDPKWERQVVMNPPQDRHHIFDVAPGHALFGITKLNVAGAVTSLTLPSELGGELHWEGVADVGRHIVNFGMALEEHDLIACLTCMNVNNPSNFQVHLVNHSTAEHHLSASAPIINVHTPHLQPGDAWGDIAVCGENLAVSLKYPITTDLTLTYRLYIWNWKSGILKADIELDSGYHLSAGLQTPGLTFLREDILVNPNTTVNSLDVYHIPSSLDIGHLSVRSISRFHLPRLAKSSQHYYIQSHLSPSPRSSSELNNISTKKPFINDPERTILAVVLVLFNNETWISFTLLVRWQYLLARCLEDLAEGPRSDTLYHAYSWEEWGPQNSRLIPEPYHPPFAMKTTGSRWVSLVENPDQHRKDLRANPPRKIEVYDFDEIRTRIAEQRAVTVKHRGRFMRVHKIKTKDDKNKDTYPRPLVELVDATSPSVYPTSDGTFAQEVRTCLPYLRTTYIESGSGSGRLKMKQRKLAKWMKKMFRHRRDIGSNSLEDSDAKVVKIDTTRPDLGQWDGLFVDDQRIIGINFEWDEGRCHELEILYLG